MEPMDINEQIDINYISNQLFKAFDKRIVTPAWYQTVTKPQITYTTQHDQSGETYKISTEIGQ